jgi:menaquinol-cytochrome c reductase iron-sulfur subunit
MQETNRPSSGPENPRRRTFLVGLISVMGGFITLVLGGSGLFYFLSPAWRGKKEDWVELGPVANLKEDEPVKVDYLQRKSDGWEVIESPDTVWILKSKNDLVAYDPHCTHLGCHYRWDTDKEAFLCPCHGGTFNKQGEVVSGPPPRPLRRFTTKVENGSLFLLPEDKKS